MGPPSPAPGGELVSAGRAGRLLVLHLLKSHRHSLSACLGQKHPSAKCYLTLKDNTGVTMRGYKPNVHSLDIKSLIARGMESLGQLSWSSMRGEKLT